MVIKVMLNIAEYNINEYRATSNLELTVTSFVIT